MATYKKVAEDLMAIPVIDGRKSESEKFAGASDTYTIEAMMQMVRPYSLVHLTS